jgi:RNA polymerase sigma-70 factor (ECF subfamily)
LLVQLYSPLIYHWCRQARTQPADAADVVQEVFRAIAQGLPRFAHGDSHGSFRGWLRTITRNKLADLVRRRHSEPPGAGGSTAHLAVQSLPAPDELADEPPVQADLDEEVCSALAQLRSEVHETTWQAFWQTTVEGRAAGDVAADLGLKVGAVYQAKSRLLQRLKSLLSPG